MWPEEKRSKPPSTYTTLWPGRGAGALPEASCTYSPASFPELSLVAASEAVQFQTLAPGFMPVSSVA